MNPILKTEDLTHIYGADTPFEKAAIHHVDFQVERGEFLGLIGHTGSGKSTLIQHFNGLLKPTEGRVLLDGEDIWKDGETTRAARFRVGLVFQYPEHQLFEETVYKDIAFGPKNMGLPEDEVDRRVREAARFAGVDEDLLEKSPFDLSGGEKRRAAIAGVIAMEPEVLILDEPTAGLDPLGREEILGRIREYHREEGSTIIFVTHSMEDIAKNADRIAVMERSGVRVCGTPAEIFSQAEELERMGLAVPQVTQLFMRLQKMGYSLGLPYTVEQARDILLAAKGVGRC